MGCHARPTRGGMLLSMRSRKQTEWQSFSWRAPAPTLEGRKEKAKTEGEENQKGDQTLAYLGDVKPVTSREDVPLRGTFRLGRRS
ncbi:hypothetical protein AVEN_236316-1 [Araneus ventricosus]|uniref:Uncharacterized protein n=1 Tax=Araneus ventricosus TaxID=182803 RepID=A0A4Y2RKH1_ARAVE|nr:hypothetical protein AVEN_236316-1 [Araneus ventricosus]